MSAAVVTGLGAIAVALVTLVTFLIRRHDHSKNPVPRVAAEVAVVKDSLGIVTDSRDTLVEDVSRLMKDRAKDRERLDVLDTEVQGLRAELRAVRAGWSRFYQDLRDRWPDHRARDSPPPPPDLT